MPTAATPLTPEQRALRARIAAHAMHRLHDPRETTAKARAAYRTSFEEQVDPDRLLPEAERARRVQSARKEHFARLSYQSSRARSARAQKNTPAGAHSAGVLIVGKVRRDAVVVDPSL